MKKILALSLTFALASTFGICSTIDRDSQSTLRQELDNMHLTANSMDVEYCCGNLLFDNGARLNNANNEYSITTLEERDDNVNRVETGTPSNNAMTNDVDKNVDRTSPNSTDRARNLNENRVDTNNANVTRTSGSTNANNSRVTNANNTRVVNSNDTNRLTPATDANIASSDIAADNRGTSPYGIGNANNGVLPNSANNPNTNNADRTNLDSMVRTNNIDTYRNNANQNIDGKIYNNNGAVIGNNGGVNTVNGANAGRIVNNSANTNTIQNGRTVTPNTTNTVNNANLDNRNNGINPNPSVISPKTTLDRQNPTRTTADATNTTQNRANTNTQTATMQNNSASRAQNTTSQKSTPNRRTVTFGSTDTNSVDYAEMQNKIDELNSRLSTINATMDASLATARQNIQRVIDKEITLTDAQSNQINSYSRLLRKITNKLTQNDFELMHSAGEIALAESNQARNTDLSATYLDMQYTLTCREHCINCANEALDAINDIFADFDTTDTTDTTTRTGTDTPVVTEHPATTPATPATPAQNYNAKTNTVDQNTIQTRDRVTTTDRGVETKLTTNPTQSTTTQNTTQTTDQHNNTNVNTNANTNANTNTNMRGTNQKSNTQYTANEYSVPNVTKDFQNKSNDTL